MQSFNYCRQVSSRSQNFNFASIVWDSWPCWLFLLHLCILCYAVRTAFHLFHLISSAYKISGSLVNDYILHGLLETSPCIWNSPVPSSFSGTISQTLGSPDTSGRIYRRPQCDDFWEWWPRLALSFYCTAPHDRRCTVALLLAGLPASGLVRL